MATRKSKPPPKMKWQDTSNHTQSDKVRTPNCWTLQLKSAHLRFELVLHRWMGDTESWYLTTYGDVRLFQCTLLIAKEVEKAKEEAVEMLRARVAELIKLNQEMLERLP